MSGAGDWPITHVTVVTDPVKCPPGYILIDRTNDKREDADLWRDGIFSRKVCRYMCVERCAPSPGRDVLVDVAIVNERDPIPPGFTCVDFTNDTREKATKKKMLCTRYMSCNLTSTAITELIFLSRGCRRPPNGYTLIGELNAMALCYKMESIKSQIAPASEPSTPSYQYNNSPYTHSNSGPMDLSSVSSALPYSVNTTTVERMRGSSQPGTLDRMGSTLDSQIGAISGVPFQLNPKYADLARLNNITIPQIKYKTFVDIENEYSYDFSAERCATQTMTRRN